VLISKSWSTKHTVCVCAPEVIPDVDIEARVGKDLFLDEKIPRHGSGQRYVRVEEQSVLWKEKEASKVLT
jgi:hypothetical protein